MDRHAVLDASALLALYQQEPGASVVEDYLREFQCVISAVNWAEVLTILVPQYDADDAIRKMAAAGLDESILAIAPFGPREAADSARFCRRMGKQSLSLGDRACLSLAERLAVPVLTTDTFWSKSPFYERIIQIRPV